MYVISYRIAGAADTHYVPVPVAGRVIKAQSVVDGEDVGTAAKTITLSDGTTDIGVITAAIDAVEGDLDNIVMDSTSEGKVALGPTVPIQIVMAGAGNGIFSLSIVIDEYHGA